MSPAREAGGGGHPRGAPIHTAAVLGLGVVGGSLARDLASLGVRVLGLDADRGALDRAVDEGVVADAVGADLAELEEADAVVLAVPVDVARDLLPGVAAAAPRAALITDVGSTKGRMVASAEACGVGPRFVGGHPLAGDHRSGWSASRRGLFQGAVVYLCPAQGAASRALATAADLWRRVGASPMVMGAAEHDRTLAWISHLPQAASTAIALALAGGGHPRSALGPGGQDATRLAGSAPSMWAPVALENAAELAPALEALECVLAGLRAALGRQDRVEVERFFAEGRHWSGT